MADPEDQHDCSDEPKLTDEEWEYILALKKE